MDEMLQQKLEALTVMNEYLEKLIPGMETLCGELKGDRKEDTDDFMKQCVDGLNWVVEIYNATSELLTERGVAVDKTNANNAIMALGDALKSKEDAAIAAKLEDGVIPFLRQLKEAASKVAE